MKRKTWLAVVFVFSLFASILSVYADSVSGPGDCSTYHLGTDFRESRGLWVIDLINIDYSGLTDLGGSGKEAFQFMIHEWDGGLADWALIGVQVHKENGAYAFQLFYDVSPHGPWQVVRSHGIPDGTHNAWPFTTTFDMRITLRYDGVKFIVLAYFRVLGETEWTLFYDCQVSGPAEITVPDGLFDNADIQVQIDGQSDGTVTFDPPTLAPPQSEVWVDDDFNTATPGWGATRFAQIQDGIDVVASGGIVHVADGTYSATSLASVVITKPLTLSGQSRANTIIDAGVWGTSGAGWPKGIHSYADNVIIERFTIQGFTGDLVNTGGYGVVFRDYAHDTAGEGYIYYANCELRNVRVLNCYSSIYALVHTHLTVENCYVKDSLADGMFIAKYSSYATITHNTVLNSGDHGIWVGYDWTATGPSDHATITYNTVDGAREGGISFVASDDALIEGNTVTNVKGEEPEGTGGWSRGAVSLKDGVSNVIVARNNIHGNDGLGTGSGRGIGIDGSWSNIDINHNFIQDNAGGGIKVMGTGTGYFKCNFNCISGNTGYGAENIIGSPLNFENNYWGHNSGPYHPTTNPDGTGDRVSDNVDYEPWLTTCPLLPVGGIWVPIEKYELLAPWIGLASLIAVAAVSVGYLKRRKKKQT